MQPNEFASFIRSKLPNHQTGANISVEGAKFWQDSANLLTEQELMTFFSVIETCLVFYGVEVNEQIAGVPNAT